MVSREALAGPRVAMIFVRRSTALARSTAVTVPAPLPCWRQPERGVTTLCVIPLKPFEAAKGRLGTVLSPRARARLGAATASRVVGACRDAGFPVLVVTSDPGVRRWAAGLGVGTAGEPAGGGLDGAAAAGAARALAAGDAYAVVHGDLPIVRAADVAAALGRLRPGSAVLAPSRDGGTNLLAADTPLRFGYGPGSFRYHLGASAHLRPEVVVRPGLAVDLDTAADLAGAARLPGGEWLAGFLPDGPS
jgi:2-phospho-L-lactate guanylyltransferase